MKMPVKVLEKKPGSPATVIGRLEVEARTVDACEAEARRLIKREIRTISHGPRGLVVYVKPRRLTR